ncbi:MAG: serine/threonine-protein kinase [Gemmatimonas sp.]
MTTFEEQLRVTLSQTYDIERELGGGGMSRVFVATDRSLGRKVVIKLLSPELTAEVNRGRFRREIQVAAQLTHPHIVPLLSAGEHEDLLYFTMPFIAGESLKSALEESGRLPIVDVVRILYHVSEALEYAHGEGVVHRDIKPANILRSGAYSLITDFGVAKALNASMPAAMMTSTGMAVGTPAYMAPEQLAGDARADHRIDIYALGLLAYELLNGRSPFAASTPQRVLAAVLTQNPQPLIDVRPDVPRSLSELVMSCLSKEPDERPASATEVLDALDIFSTASGEIRTTEHTVPRLRTPINTAVQPTPTREQTATTVADSTADAAQATQSVRSSDEVPYVGYDRPKKNRSRMVAGGLGILVLVAAAAIFLSQRGGGGSPENVALPGPVVADSASLAPAPVAATDSVAAGKAAAVAPVDSQAIADSLKRVARAEAAKKAAAKADSLRRVQETIIRSNARGAVAAMLADENARKSFAQGATHMGGVLGTQRKGDLQTQIDALQPFLKNSGLTYEQFKAIVAASGVKLFDQYGRMVPDSLRRFAAGIN